MHVYQPPCICEPAALISNNRSPTYYIMEAVNDLARSLNINFTGDNIQILTTCRKTFSSHIFTLVIKRREIRNILEMQQFQYLIWVNTLLYLRAAAFFLLLTHHSATIQKRTKEHLPTYSGVSGAIFGQSNPTPGL